VHEWVAHWVDVFPEPDGRGEDVGTASIEGTRGEVLAWAKAQPPQVHLVFAPGKPGEWTPIAETAST